MTTEIAIPADKTPAVVPDKPLSGQQQKNLTEIVNGDFQDLRDRTRYELQRQLDARLDEIEASFADTKKQEAARKKLDVAYEKAKAILEKAQDEIRATGLSHDDGRTPPSPLYSVSVTNYGLVMEGKNKAIQRAHEARDRVQRTADLVINRRHRESNRQILLSGITAPSAADLVNGLPKAADIIGEVTAEIAVNNEADLRELHLIK